MRVIYDPDLSNLNFKEQVLSRTKYLNKLLLQTESATNNDARTKGEQFNTRYEKGILHVYIDDMKKPFLSTIVNLGEMFEGDTMYRQVDGVQAKPGYAYVSFAAATQNHPFLTKQRNSVNSQTHDLLRDDGNMSYQYGNDSLGGNRSVLIPGETFQYKKGQQIFA